MQAGLLAEFLDSHSESTEMLADLPNLNTPLRVQHFLKRHIIPRILTAVSILERRSIHEPHIVTMAFFGLAQLVAERFKAGLTTVFLAPDHLAKWETATAFISLYMREEISGLGSQLKIAPIKESTEMFNQKKNCMALWPAWFEQSKAIHPEVKRVGFLPTNESPNELSAQVKNIVEGTPAPILIIGSSGRSVWGKHFFELAAQSCAMITRPTIMVVQHQNVVPDVLPENVLLVERLFDIRRVMSRCSLVIHHGGIGTVSDALAAGCPQVILSDGFDRTTNGKIVELLGAGRVLDVSKCNDQELNAAIADLNSSREIYEKCTDYSTRIKQQNTADAACSLIEYPLTGPLAG